MQRYSLYSDLKHTCHDLEQLEGFVTGSKMKHEPWEAVGESFKMIHGTQNDGISPQCTVQGRTKGRASGGQHNTYIGL